MSDHVSQPASHIIRLLDRMDRSLTAASPIAVAMIGISSIYYVAFSYGLAVVGLLFGRERAGQVRLIRMCDISVHGCVCVCVGGGGGGGGGLTLELNPETPPSN